METASGCNPRYPSRLYIKLSFLPSKTVFSQATAYVGHLGPLLCCRHSAHGTPHDDLTGSGQAGAGRGSPRGSDAVFVGQVRLSTSGIQTMPTRPNLFVGFEDTHVRVGRTLLKENHLLQFVERSFVACEESIKCAPFSLRDHEKKPPPIDSHEVAAKAVPRHRFWVGLLILRHCHGL